jgi:hypothetical protein
LHWKNRKPLHKPDPEANLTRPPASSFGKNPVRLVTTPPPQNIRVHPRPISSPSSFGNFPFPLPAHRPSRFSKIFYLPSFQLIPPKSRLEQHSPAAILTSARGNERRPARFQKRMHTEDHDENRGDINSGEFELPNSKKFTPQHYDPRDFHSSDPRATGLCTPEDAANIAYPHGRSQKFILRYENPAEYEALHKKWWDEYQPSGHIEETLVQLLIDNHWLFKRARLRLEQVEWDMPMNAKHWIEDYQKLVETFTRFKTTAERAFQRAFREVELHFRECVRAENMAHKAELLRAKIEAEIVRKPEEAKQIALKMATPLYRDRQARAAARTQMQLTNPPNNPFNSAQPDASPPQTSSPLCGQDLCGQDS